VTPNRIYTLQAATESAMNEWVNALNTYRRHALRKEDGDTSPRRASVSGETLPGNDNLNSPLVYWLINDSMQKKLSRQYLELQYTAL